MVVIVTIAECINPFLLRKISEKIFPVSIFLEEADGE